MQRHPLLAGVERLPGAHDLLGHLVERPLDEALGVQAVLARRIGDGVEGVDQLVEVRLAVAHGHVAQDVGVVGQLDGDRVIVEKLLLDVVAGVARADHVDRQPRRVEGDDAVGADEALVEAGQQRVLLDPGPRVLGQPDGGGQQRLALGGHLHPCHVERRPQQAGRARALQHPVDDLDAVLVDEVTLDVDHGRLQESAEQLVGAGDRHVRPL